MIDTSTGVYQQALAQTQEMLKAREFELALTQIEAILEVHPADARTHLLKGIALRNLGRHEEAVAILARLAAGTRGVASVHQELGLSLYALRRADEAIEEFRAAVEINPKLAGSWHKLGELLYRGGAADEEAEQAFRNAMAATHTHPGIIKALDLIRQQQYGMAEGICRDYLQRFPTDVSVIRLLAEVGLKLGVRGDPETLLKRCLELAPDYHLARNTYANALSHAQKYEQALAEIDYLEKVEPENPSHSILAASIEIMVGAYEEAEQRYGRLASRMPHFAQMQNNHGHTLKTLGRNEQAIAAYRRAITIAPHYGDAYWNLANLKTFRFEPAEIEQMRSAIAAEENSPRDYYHLCFALGKALEDLEQFDESFQYYDLGNAAKCKEEGYRAEDNHAAIQALITTCTPELIQNKAGYGCTAPDPIFIVGLPRSGSTLLEQILASHSMVDGTSELREMISIARRLGGQKNKLDESLYPGALWDLSESDCKALGEEYLERTRVQRRGAPFFIDKMPNNFEHVALISTILPNAKIIDSRRHPMASCFSGFKQLFEAGQTFTYSQTDMARYFRDYAELMDHWDHILPGKVMRVTYERVIADTETEVRRILDYCGLPFEESCLAFYSTERAVHTASAEQVRQPIYTSALEQWRHYDQQLGPMRSELSALIASHNSPERPTR